LGGVMQAKNLAAVRSLPGFQAIQRGSSCNGPRIFSRSDIRNSYIPNPGDPREGVEVVNMSVPKHTNSLLLASSAQLISPYVHVLQRDLSVLPGSTCSRGRGFHPRRRNSNHLGGAISHREWQAADARFVHTWFHGQRICLKPSALRSVIIIRPTGDLDVR
jgi:hypothetical protein